MSDETKSEASMTVENLALKLHKKLRLEGFELDKPIILTAMISIYNLALKKAAELSHNTNSHGVFIADKIEKLIIQPGGKV